jgi:hypothetical protein
MNSEQIERILQNTKRSMEIEGFTIDETLEANGRKLLVGEVTLEEYISAITRKIRTA